METWEMYKRNGKILTETLQTCVTVYIKEQVDNLIQEGRFPNISEFLRFLIIKYFDEVSRTE